MKKIILPLLTLFTLNAFSQQDSTTVITGSLKVGDSLNVSNTLQAGAITSRGDMVSLNNLRSENDLYVEGKAEIAGVLKVLGASKLLGGVLTPTLVIGTAADNLSISTQTLGNGAKVMAFGFAGPVIELPSKCIQPYNSSSLSIFSNRAGVINGSSNNMLDFNNDGSNGTIDYGFDINQYSMFDPNNPNPQVRPALKINGLCWGDVEIAKGGGFVSTGGWFEVGNPVRNGAITSNINSTSGRIGQRITSASSYPEAYPNPPEQFNTQLFVNRSKIKALTVYNTATNPNGDQTFVVYGSGKTHIGTGRPLATGVCPNAMLTVDGTILAKEVRVAISTTTHWADYVFDKDYKLMPLNEVESYIKTNKHLPEVPSSEDVEKNGIEVTEISAILLKKIEELTLYTIELQKKVDAQQKEINTLKKH